MKNNNFIMWILEMRLATQQDLINFETINQFP
jgi:hypothetical protein